MTASATKNSFHPGVLVALTAAHALGQTAIDSQFPFRFRRVCRLNSRAEDFQFRGITALPLSSTSTSAIVRHQCDYAVPAGETQGASSTGWRHLIYRGIAHNAVGKKSAIFRRREFSAH